MLGTIAYAFVAALGLGGLLWFGSDRRVHASAAWPLALAWCWGVELFQLTPLPAEWERSWYGWHLIFGSTFDWVDMALYPVGVALGALALLFMGHVRRVRVREARDSTPALTKHPPAFSSVAQRAAGSRLATLTVSRSVVRRLMLRWFAGCVVTACVCLIVLFAVVDRAIDRSGAADPAPIFGDDLDTATFLVLPLALVAVITFTLTLPFGRRRASPTESYRAFRKVRPALVLVGAAAAIVAALTITSTVDYWEAATRDNAERQAEFAASEAEAKREQAATQPLSSPTAIVPPPSVEPSEPPASAGPAVTAKRECTQEDVRYTLEGAEPVMPGNGAGMLSAKNVSSSPCWVQGRPLLRIDQGGRTLAITSGAPEVIAGTGEDRRVHLAAGAKAWAQLGWRGDRTADREQELPQTLLVSLSDARNPVAAGFAPTMQASPHPFDLVDGGHLGVSTFSSSAPR